MSVSVKNGLVKAKVLKERFNKFGSVALALGLSGVAYAADAEGASNSFAVDLGPYWNIVAIVLTSIGAIWIVKKMISLGNKS